MLEEWNLKLRINTIRLRVIPAVMFVWIAFCHVHSGCRLFLEA